MTLKQFEYDGKGFLRAVPSAGEVVRAAGAAQLAEAVAPEIIPVNPLRSAAASSGRWARVRAALAKWLSDSPDHRLRVDFERWRGDRGDHQRRARRLQQSLMLTAISLR